MTQENKHKIIQLLKEYIECNDCEDIIRRLNGFILTSDPVYLPVENGLRNNLGKVNTQELLDIILEAYVK